MHRIFLHFVSFVCVAFGQPAWAPCLGPLAGSIGFALHWIALRGLSGKVAERCSFFWFLSVQLLQLSWMVSFEYLGFYIFFVYLLLAAGLGLQFALMTKILVRHNSFEGGDLCAIAGFWVLMEWIRLKLLCGFAFNFVGVSLSCYTWSLQTASIFGLLGMSFWVMLANLAAWRAFYLRSWRGWVLISLCPYVYGCIFISYQDFRREKKEPLEVLLVQTGIPLSQKYALKGREEEFVSPKEQWEKILRSIACGQKHRLDLIVFPEAVLPWGLDLYGYSLEEVRDAFIQHFGEGVQGSFPPLVEPFASQGYVSNAYQMQALANIFRAPVVAGLDYQGSEGCYNSAFYFEPGSISYPQRYDKRILLPMAEYIPCSWLVFLSRLYGVEDFFQPGDGAKIYGSYNISPSICYEELFSSIMREGRRKGARLFVNLSNDGWYPCSRLPFQHFSQGLIRSVENGIPLVRACNTGVTAAVDSFGRVVGKLEDSQGGVENVSGCLQVQVPMESHETFYSLLGDLPLLLACIIFMAVVLGKKRAFSPKRALEIGLDENEERM